MKQQKYPDNRTQPAKYLHHNNRTSGFCKRHHNQIKKRGMSFLYKMFEKSEKRKILAQQPYLSFVCSDLMVNHDKKSQKCIYYQNYYINCSFFIHHFLTHIYKIFRIVKVCYPVIYRRLQDFWAAFVQVLQVQIHN